MANSSVTNVKVNNASQQAIKDQMAANSAAWHTAPSGDKNTPGTKEWLADQNKGLADQLGGLSFDSGSGTWSGTAGQTSGREPAREPTTSRYDDYGDPAPAPDVGSVGAASDVPGASNAGQSTPTKTYTGGNAELDAQLAKYSKDYMDARARGDAAGMKAANDAANLLRSMYRFAEESASEDIGKVEQSTAAGTSPEYYVDPAAPSTAPEGFRGSAAGVQAYTPEQAEIIAEMNKNSVDWHSADATTKKYLEARNEYLASLLNGEKGGVTFDPVSGNWSGSAEAPVQQPVVPQAPITSAPSVDKVEEILQKPHDISGMQKLLDEWKKAAEAQSGGVIDKGVQDAIIALERALADAQSKYKEQVEQVARDEFQSRDNSALYSEMRGDKGGIGREQYDSIANTAAQNRLAVQQAQTKLSTDTSRQIEDLRAQGEFEKADKLLEISQTYLGELVSLEKWAAEYNLSVEQFNERIREWEAEFQQAADQFNANLQLSAAQLAGKFSDGTNTAETQALIDKQLANSGQAMLAAGLIPNNEQLAAMGMSRDQADQYVKALQLEKAAARQKADSEKAEADAAEAKKEQYKNMPLAELYSLLYKAGFNNRSENAVTAYLSQLSGLAANDAWVKAIASAYVETGYNDAKNLAAKLEQEGPALQALEQNLSRIEDTGLESAVPTRASMAIAQAWLDGRISRETAANLIKTRYGLDPDKFLIE